MSMSNARLFGTWALLLAATVSQVQSKPKLQSAVLNSAAEAMVVKKAPVLRSEPVNPHHPADAKKEDVALAKKDDTTPAKVNIEVYYETRCPGCLMFISETLEPLYRNAGMADSLNITMVTYGNGMTIPMVEVSEGYKFWHPETTGHGWDSVQICQHGSDECLGNLVQLCTKDLETHAKYMELIFCMANTTIHGYGEEKSTFECMEKAKVDHHKVRECVNSPHGNDLVNEAGKTTHALKGRDATPWVMIQGEHVADENVLMNSTLLLESVCKHVKNVPVPCAAFHSATPKPAAKKEAPHDDGDDFQVFKDMKNEEFIEVSKV